MFIIVVHTSQTETVWPWRLKLKKKNYILSYTVNTAIKFFEESVQQHSIDILSCFRNYKIFFQSVFIEKYTQPTNGPYIYTLYRISI